MKIVIKYIADDGRQFDDEQLCAAHEKNCDLAEIIMSQLPKRPKNTNFTSGVGFIQHNENTLLSIRNEFLEFTKRYIDHEWIQLTIDGGFDIHTSYVGRILSEAAPTTIYKYWHRFGCIDTKFREWGQPYYVDNPDKAEQIRLNVKR